ncbi:hypothetical protein [Frankia sp. AgB32]|uniref:hypothetical protein n=1 Tax=Frankia sp. AgB32 TaxID=631119 RepID=UPI00200F8398|nr:hypothetical protein [Frankia sp. AgB32]MCK9895005.1 hypothetical protein [Frankia sp. AgB32]
MARTDRPARPRQRPHPTGDSDAQVRGLVGAGQTRLPPVIAMRARDVDRPTEADLADADRTLVLRRGQRLPPPTDAADLGETDRAAETTGAPPVTLLEPAEHPRRGADGRAARPPAPVPAAAGARRSTQDAEEAAPGAAGTSPVRS